MPSCIFGDVRQEAIEVNAEFERLVSSQQPDEKEVVMIELGVLPEHGDSKQRMIEDTKDDVQLATSSPRQAPPVTSPSSSGKRDSLHSIVSTKARRRSLLKQVSDTKKQKQQEVVEKMMRRLMTRQESTRVLKPNVELEALLEEVEPIFASKLVVFQRKQM